MSTTITSDNGVEIKVAQLGMGLVHPEGITSIWARLSDAQRVELAAALDPGRRGLHVRLDNQASTLATYRRELDAEVIRADRAEREWGAWKARAEQAEMERADREREEIADQFATFRAEIVAEAVKSRESAVTRVDIEKVVEAVFDREAGYDYGSDKPWPGTEPVASAVWDYLKDSDPAVYVAGTRADIEECVYGSRRAGRECDEQGFVPVHVQEAVERLCDLLGIEAEQAVDPVEEQTDALADILYGHEMVTDQMRGVLERVVRAGMLFPEQEADQ